MLSQRVPFAADAAGRVATRCRLAGRLGLPAARARCGGDLARPLLAARRSRACPGGLHGAGRPCRTWVQRPPALRPDLARPQPRRGTRPRPGARTAMARGLLASARRARHHRRRGRDRRGSNGHAWPRSAARPARRRSTRPVPATRLPPALIASLRAAAWPPSSEAARARAGRSRRARLGRRADAAEPRAACRPRQHGIARS